MKDGQIIKRGQQRPLICAPLVGRTIEALIEETAVIVAKQPDLVEWRVDFFDQLFNEAKVLEAALQIKEKAQGIPVLFTRRSCREGGEAISLDEEEVAHLYERVMREGLIDLIDVELSCPENCKERLRGVAEETGTELVMSFHDFNQTPAEDDIVAKLQEAERQGADVGKIAVMPSSISDVLILMQATQKATDVLSIPVITMSMGRIGSLSRMMGGACGSALTFAVGSGRSAPGQMPIDELRGVLDVIDRVM